MSRRAFGSIHPQPFTPNLRADARAESQSRAPRRRSLESRQALGQCSNTAWRLGERDLLSESVYPQLPVGVTEAAAAAHAKLIDKAIFFRSECEKRLAAIEEQSRAIEALQSALDNRVPTAD